MLEELKRINYPGDYDDLVYFLQKIINDKQLTKEEIVVLSSHVPHTVRIATQDMLTFCNMFGFLIINEKYYSINPSILELANNEELLRNQIVTLVVKKLFDCDVFIPEYFDYDVYNDVFVFLNHKFPLAYSNIRNFLNSTGFFVCLRTDSFTRFYVSFNYSQMIISEIKKNNKRITINELKKKIEENEIAGEIAEKYVLDYEKNRLNQYLSESVKKISDFNVSAGYDIVSFNDNNSIDYDRFIEVKAVTNSLQFYWSRNEIDTARIKTNNYYLYLVNLKMIEDADYVPLIIKNPASVIFNSDCWIYEPESFRVQLIDLETNHNIE